jgi:hypothetical protein
MVIIGGNDFNNREVWLGIGNMEAESMEVIRFSTFIEDSQPNLM